MHNRITVPYCPIQKIICLHKNQSGRYETEQGYVWVSESKMEVLVMDKFHKVSDWISTRVEQNDIDYDLVG